MTPFSGRTAAGCVRPALRNKKGWRTKEQTMTLIEISVEYRAQATVIQQRLRELQAQLPELDSDQKSTMEGRIRMLTVMWREARELAVLCERYYDRGYRRNGKYTL